MFAASEQRLRKQILRWKPGEKRQQKVLGDEEVRRCGSTEMNGDLVSEDVERYKAI